MLKRLAKVLSKPITMIFQESIKRRIVPKQWKIAWITVVFKKGRRLLAGNYRPISLTSVLSNLIEKIIRDHISEHMVTNGFYSNKQYGFIKKRSAPLQLLEAMDKWTEALDKGSSVDCIYADFQKAFDKVPHRRLMVKIRAYGISENICEWIEDFLKDRKQIVKINGKGSKEEVMISGVPQGSVIGPLLFVIFINDLPDLVESILMLFADDSKIWKEINGTEDQEMLQKDLDTLKKWSLDWLLIFHPDKLKQVHISSRNEEHDTNYKIGNDKVVDSKSEKDLGIIVDQRLNFEEHMLEKTKKANITMGMIRRSFQFLNRKTFLLLYKGLVRSIIEHAGTVWSPYKMKDIERVEGVQRRATAQLPGMKGKEYEERLKELKLPTLRYRRARGDMIQVYKILNGLDDNQITPKLMLSKEARGNSENLRGKHPFHLYQKRCRLEIRKHSFTQRVVKPWNYLSREVVMAATLNEFKSKLDIEWQDQEGLYNFRKGIYETDDPIE